MISLKYLFIIGETKLFTSLRGLNFSNFKKSGKTPNIGVTFIQGGVKWGVKTHETFHNYSSYTKLNVKPLLRYYNFIASVFQTTIKN